jgi:hypothetical protein
LEFGEDYRNDLDSLSDCPSSLSNELRNFRPHYPHKRSPPKRPKGFGSAERSVLTEMRMLDSDSDVEDLVHVVETSASQYSIALNTFHKVLNNFRLEPSQYVSYSVFLPVALSKSFAQRHLRQSLIQEFWEWLCK